MKTTEQWLSEIKNDKHKLDNWLKRQYIGEELAAERITSLADSVPTQYQNIKTLLNVIAEQERTHALWVEQLLVTRGIDIPEVSYEGTRYWQPILEEEHSFEEITAAGYHAEKMRLVRIRALANDLEIPEDIRETFRKILPQEEFHEFSFKKLTTDEDIKKMATLHEAGMKLLGLEA